MPFFADMTIPESLIQDLRKTGAVFAAGEPANNVKNGFTTYEKVETMPLVVIKKDGSRQPFDREKLIERILRACHKRKVSLTEIERLGR